MIFNQDAIIVGKVELTGDFVTVKEVSELLARNGKPLSRAVARGVFTSGSVAADGQRYRPACVKVGREWVTTRAVLGEYLSRLAGCDEEQPAIRIKRRHLTRAGLAEHGVLVDAGDGSPRLRIGTDDSLRTRTSAPETPIAQRSLNGVRSVF